MVSWVATDPAKKLYIEFTEQPFENMQQQANGRFRVRCNGHRCHSDKIRQELEYSEYKYFQILEDASGVRDEVDGMIIIVP